ncbi:MAG: TAXI family TRAP transporter solute-binding subunit [Desulfurococcales archaeon]|nr:TAXI family TRAP transporter solute-binding subunit [Desulfurococcales archaeon]
MRRGASTATIAAAIIIIIIIIAGAAYYMAKKGGEKGAGEQGPYKITILTGGVGGTYYPVGTTYAKLLNKYSNGKISATGLEGKASVSNIQEICKGTANAGLAQNDISYYAYNGVKISAFEGKPQKCIRAVAVLYPETIQIVTLKDSGINTLQDLAGKKVVVGAEGSGTYWNARQILEAAGVWDQIVPVYKKFSDAKEDLKNGAVDAAFYTAGIPTSAIEQLASEVPIKIIPVPTEIYQKLIQNYPFYVQQTIPAGTYNGLDQDVQTVAVMSMLLVHKDVPKDIVYLMTKILFEHVDELKSQVGKTSVQYISLDHALDGLSIPLHEGAYQYYVEKGLQVPDEFKPTSG